MSTYEITLDQSRCLAYGSCVGIAPQAFLLPDGSPMAVLLKEQVDDSEIEDIEEAVRNCAARAISVRQVD